MRNDYGGFNLQLMERIGIDPVSDDDRRKAIRHIAANARNAEDYAYLLAALGLDPKDGR